MARRIKRERLIATAGSYESSFRLVWPASRSMPSHPFRAELLDSLLRKTHQWLLWEAYR
jgi:hypothetical protein